MTDPDVIRLSDVRTVPDMTIGADPAANPDQPGWQRIDLSDPQYAIPPDPPAVAGLLYHGKRHVISGPPESAKTLIAYRLLLEAHRAGHPVTIIDLEMGATAARRMLHDIGATQDELHAIYYVEPTEPPTGTDLDRIADHGTRFVLLDAAAGAYHASGLDDNARKDVERFAAVWIRPLWQDQIGTLVVDHVTKDRETRGKFTIGSERKLGQADVHLSCEALKTLSRGGTGLVKVHVHKDRPGFLQRPTAAVIDLHSHPDTHAITWTLREATVADTETGGFKPTRLMQAVSRWLEKNPGQHSLNEIEAHVKGKGEYKRDAIEQLIQGGYAIETEGPRRARLIELAKPYIAPSDDLVPTSSPLRPDEVNPTSSLRPPLTGDEDEVEIDEERTPTSSQDEVAYLTDKYADQLADDGIPW
jgi:hypothetical protein